MKTKGILTMLLAAAVLLAVPPPAFGQKVGTSSFQFLKVMPTARATAMGDAFVALGTGADAVYWNPAGLTSATSHEFSTTMTLWLFDTKQSAISYALPLGDFGTVGAQFQFVDYGSIEETRVDQLAFVGSGSNLRYNPGLTGRSFSPSAYVVGLSYARQLTERFSTGITAKYVYESLFDSRSVTVPNANGGSDVYNTFAKVFLFDFGMRYNTGFRSIVLGASVQNFGSQVKFASEGYPAPLAFRLGAVADVMGANGLLIHNEDNRVTIAYDIFQPNDYRQQMHVGVEYSFSELFALRGGYKASYDSDGLTLGAGAATSLSEFNIRFDYSYGDMGEFLDKVHRLSLGVTLP